MNSASPSASEELADGLADDGRLVGDLAEFNPGRQFRIDALERRFEFLAHLDDIIALRHHGAEHDAFLAVLPDFGDRRILDAALNGCDVADADCLAARSDP